MTAVLDFRRPEPDPRALPHNLLAPQEDPNA